MALLGRGLPRIPGGAGAPGCCSCQACGCPLSREFPRKQLPRVSAPFQVHPEGKFVVDVDKNIDINDVSAPGLSGVPRAGRDTQPRAVPTGHPQLPRGPAQ